jgi:hypothetical protein
MVGFWRPWVYLYKRLVVTPTSRAVVNKGTGR